MLKATPPYQAHTIFAGIALKPVVGIVVIIEFHIFVGRIAQAVFKGDIVKERLVLVGHLGTGRYLATYHYLQAVVPETLGEFERIVGVGVSAGICGIIHTKAQVERAQGIACDIVDFALQERTECAVHGETAGVA